MKTRGASLDYSDDWESRPEAELIEALRRRGFTHLAVNAVMRARGILMPAIGAALAKFTDSDHLIAALYSQLVERNLRIHQLERSVGLLQARMNRIDSRHRNHYTPIERFRIIELKETYSLTVEQTSGLFVVSPQRSRAG